MRKLSILAPIAIIAVGAAAALSSLAADPDAVSRERVRPLVDTNTTTTTSSYTATAIGQELIGAVGGSNAVWKALRATSTNWVKIAQDTSAR